MTSIEETIRICAGNVKRLRTSRHVTQATVAEQVGITEKYLSDIETDLILRIEGGGLTIVHLGDLGHMPDEKQLEAMSGADIMLVPIGGTYTIDTPEAEEVIRLARPKHAVAMHYRTPDYDFNTSTCEAFERDMRAVRMPREIEITPENLVSLPEFLLMRYK